MRIPKGWLRPAKKTGVNRLYADYREMLAKEKPDVVAIGPRHVDQRVAMVQAAAAAGCHIYCEKPLASDLVDADTMLAACADAGVKMAVAHQLRGMPTIRKALSVLQAGTFGRLVRMHARGKEDRRGGGRRPDRAWHTPHGSDASFRRLPALGVRLDQCRRPAGHDRG